MVFSLFSSPRSYSGIWLSTGAVIFFTLLLTTSCNRSVVFPNEYGKEVPTLNLLGYQPQAKPLVSAHRGGRYIEGYPENALPTFEYVLERASVLIECDVSMSMDSTFLLLHDRTLDRTTTGKGPVREKSWKELKKLKLVDDYGQVTSYSIPTLSKVLKWADSRGALLTLDVKRGVPFAPIIQMLRKYRALDNAVLITYNLQAAQRVHKLAPQLVLSVSIPDSDALQSYLDAGIPPANMVAFVGTREPADDLYEQLHELGIKTILGTIGRLDNEATASGDHLYLELVRRGADIIATDRPLQAVEALN